MYVFTKNTMDFYKEEFIAPRDQRPIVRPEINLAKWPQLFAPRQTKGRSRVIDRGDSKVIVGRQIDNRGDEVEVGFLIVPDFITLLGLIELWELHDKPVNEPVVGRVRPFITQVLNRDPSGARYQELERSLKRLVHVPINWVNAFYDSRTGELETIKDYTFRFLQDLLITKVRHTKKMELSTFRFHFNTQFVENLLNNSTKPLNLNEILQLNRETAVIAYSFIDLIMAKRNRWERRSLPFLREDLQIRSVRYDRPAHRKKELEAILQDLEGRELTTGILTDARLTKTKDGTDYKIVLQKQPFQQDVANRTRQRNQASDSETNALVEEMKSKLGSGDKNEGFYRLIAQRCPRDLIHTAIQDTLAEEREGNIKTNKARFFGYWIQSLAKNRGIDLGLKSNFEKLFNS